MNRRDSKSIFCCAINRCTSEKKKCYNQLATDWFCWNWMMIFRGYKQPTGQQVRYWHPKKMGPCDAGQTFGVSVGAIGCCSSWRSPPRTCWLHVTDILQWCWFRISFRCIERRSRFSKLSKTHKTPINGIAFISEFVFIWYSLTVFNGCILDLPPKLVTVTTRIITFLDPGIPIDPTNLHLSHCYLCPGGRSKLYFWSICSAITSDTKALLVITSIKGAWEQFHFLRGINEQTGRSFPMSPNGRMWTSHHIQHIVCMWPTEMNRGFNKLVYSNVLVIAI